MDFYEKLQVFKKEKGLSNKDLGPIILMNGDTFRKALSRKSLSELELKALENFINDFGSSQANESEIMESSDPTGYYLPEVSAAAGMDKEMVNDELKRIPVDIPGWEKGVLFINVYGDSMYPKYNAGEIIGVKPIEFHYLNYGYPYVVVFQNGDVHIKIVQPGSTSEHLILESVNEFYKPKEFHLERLKSFYSIKGVIKKEMM